MPKPGSISLLYALELPASGSQTQWASGYAAYEALDKATQERVASLRRVHIHPPVALNPAESVDHPIVRRHPESGRLALFVTPYMTRRIVSLSAQEGGDRCSTHSSLRPLAPSSYGAMTGRRVMWSCGTTGRPATGVRRFRTLSGAS